MADTNDTAKVEQQGDNNLKALPVRAYLDHTVVPLLLQGMSELVNIRPDEPVQWLAQYLIDNDPQKKS
eukprot:CAMPEP_0175097312 /NCGR_PEP_ID=MMETSP0086_2-20121207/5215_1 /TAXON_ID=136419 /ORGANISM="Unknown Unknown, Strain D1" /LENGTH=67 /DNA_ID=CAMNT_0016370805 /DNA_START=48 /DNA_END=251 /DNA_ORIENTATION=+